MSDEQERCPKCGALPVEPGAYTYDWACKSSKRISGYVEESTLCLRRQLAQAQERERAALAREAWLRRVVEGVEWVWFDATGDGGTLCPYCKNSKAAGHASWCIIAAALSSSPANPYASVVEAARILEVEGSARRVLAAFDKERDRLTFDQWQALEALEEALYGGEE